MDMEVSAIGSVESSTLNSTENAMLNFIIRAFPPFSGEKNHVMEFQHLNFYITLDFPKADTYQNNKKSL